MKINNILIYSGLLFGGLFLGYLFFGGSSEPQSLEQHIAETHTKEDGEVVYTCSMHPQVRQNEPGDCPICGMELIPADEASDSDAETQNQNAVQISQTALALADIQTTEVRREVPTRQIRLTGKVAVNQNLVSNITAHFPGRVRVLYVDYVGDYIREGQKLASIYSPELITAQRELLETARFKEQNPRLYESARRKLLLWEFPEETIDQIERSGEVMEELDFFAPVSGYVSDIRISREDHISEGMILYRVANLSKVWVEFEAYESNLAGLTTGDDVEFRVSSLGSEVFTGTVDFIQPFLNDDSRTAKVRVITENQNGRMKPGMFAEGVISSGSTQTEKLLIPRSAVMWTGPRSIVFVDVSTDGNPAFEAREVVLGPRAGNDYVIESGLQAGEEVVTNGTFKVDAAAQLSDKLSMMNREPGTGANRNAHDHSSMEENSTETESDVNQAQHNNRRSVSADTTHESEHQHRAHLDILVDEYLKMKTALTEDDLEKAQRHFNAFANEVRTSTEMNNHREHAQKHEAHHQAMIAAINEADGVSGIETFRAAFKKISTELITALENQGYEGDLYKQYCPMYDGGSEWISDVEEIKNPFYGSQMHNCGETVERLNTEQGTSN